MEGDTQHTTADTGISASTVAATQNTVLDMGHLAYQPTTQSTTIHDAGKGGGDPPSASGFGASFHREYDDYDDDLLGEDDEETDNLHPGPSTILTFLLILLIGGLMLMPAVIIYYTRTFPWYNIVQVKAFGAMTGQPIVRNAYMEFIRYCVFASTSFATYLLLDWAVGTLPLGYLSIAAWIDAPVSKQTRLRLAHVRAVRVYITNGIFLIVIMGLGSLLVYKTTLFAPAPTTPPPAPAASTSTPATPTTASQTSTIQYILERLVVVLCFFAGSLAIEKYLIESIAIHFHRVAFSKRIRNLNFRFEALNILYRAAMTATAPRIVTGARASPLSRIHSRLAGSNGRGGGGGERMASSAVEAMTSPEAARAVGRQIFTAILPAGKNSLTPIDLTPFFPAAEIPSVFAVFDNNQSGDITGTEFEEAVLEMYQQRLNMQATLMSNGSIVAKLEGIMWSLAIAVAALLSMSIYDVGLLKIWSIFGICLTAFGFMFQKAGQTFFESLLFIFTVHAFDVGDRVVIDDTNLVVSRIEFFTTTFTKWDGQVVYIPNSTLSGKNIINVRRSGCQSDEIELSVGPKTSIAMLWDLRKQLLEFVTSESRDYSGYLEITSFEVVDAKKMKVKVLVQYKSNFQNTALHNARKVKFSGKLKDIVEKCGIEYVG